MALNLPNFRELSVEDMGGFDLGKAILQGLEVNKGFQEARTMPKRLAEELYAKQLQNKINQPKADYAKDITLADLANTQAGTSHLNAQTNAIPSEIENRQANTLKQRILNKYLGQREQAEIGEIGARGNYYNSGGAGGSTGSKDALQYLNGVAEDNPHIQDPARIKEAADVIASGGNKLSDGTPLNVPSFKTRTALDRAVRSTTTAAQLNQNLGAHQAESEIDVLQDYANKGLAPYGTTYFDKSPQQITDSFKSDPESQKKLGRLIGAQGLQFEIAQQRIKLANGQPGVTSTKELIDLSHQIIKTKFPKLSATAREEAARYMNEALKAGLKSRDKIGAGAGNLYKFNQQANQENNQSGNYADNIKNSFIQDNETSISNTAQKMLNQWNAAHTNESDQHSVEELQEAAKELSTKNNIVTPEQVMEMIFEKEKGGR